MTATMHEVIERFRALQEFDLKILRLDKQLARAPAALREHQQSVVRVDGKIKAVNDRSKIVKAQIKLLENDLKFKEQKITKLKEQSSEVRSNKEFVAFKSEIANAQGECDRIEGQILKTLTIVEQADVRIAQYQEERERQVDRVTSTQNEIDSKSAEARTRRDALLAERGDLLGGLPEDHMKQYERVRTARGRGAAPLEGEYCGACGEPQTRNDVYAVQNRARIVNCRARNVMLLQ